MEEPRLDMMSSSGRSLTAGCPSSSFEKPSEPPGLQQPPLTLPAVLLLLLLSEVMEAAQATMHVFGATTESPPSR